MTRPTCINHGCDQPAMVNRIDKQGNTRWRIHCSHCQPASYGKWPHREGVTPFKTGRCSNVDSHLGFKCPVKWTKIPKDAKGMTEIDHRDGDSSNNHPENLDELCPICHKIKGQRSGDYNGFRNKTKKVLGFNRKQINARKIFHEYFASGF